MSLLNLFGRKKQDASLPDAKTVTPVKPSPSEANVSEKAAVRYVVDKYGKPHVVTASEEN